MQESHAGGKNDGCAEGEKKKHKKNGSGTDHKLLLFRVVSVFCRGNKKNPESITGIDPGFPLVSTNPYSSTVHEGEHKISGRSSDFRIVLPQRLPLSLLEKVAFLLGLSPVTAAGPSSSCTKFPFKPVVLALTMGC